MKSKIKIIILLFLLSSCRKEYDKPRWDINILIPILHTELSISDINEDTSITTKADSSIWIVYKDNLASLKFDTIVEFPEFNDEYTLKLNNISLDTISVEYSISLGYIANEALNNGQQEIYDAIMNAHNTGQPTQIDPIAPLESGDILIDMSEYFETLTINQGYIDITIDNQLAIPITNIIFKLSNEINGYVIVADSFDYVGSGAIITQTEYLGAMTIYSDLIAEIWLESPGSDGEVVLDTNQTLTARIHVRDLNIVSATAYFDAQKLIEQGEQIPIEISNNILLKKLIVKQGKLDMIIFNTIEDTLFLNYKLISATKSDDTLEINDIVLPAIGGVPGELHIVKDLAGYILNMCGIGGIEQETGFDYNNNGIIDIDTVNSLYYIFSAGIYAGDNLINLSNNDSIYLYYTLQNIVPEYLSGYLGNDTVSLDSTILYSNMLASLNNPDINFQSVNISLSFTNQIGIEFGLKINNLTAINTQTNNEVSLNGSVLNNVFTIQKPVDPLSSNIPVQAVISTLNINNSNSNIIDIINNFSDSIKYDFQVILNPNHPVADMSNLTDFFYYGDSIGIDFKLAMPLSFISNRLFLEDTVKIELDSSQVKGIQQGTLYIIADNGFPLDAKVQLYLLDKNCNLIDSLLSSPQTIKAAEYSNILQRVITNSRTIIEIPASMQKIYNIVNAQSIAIQANFISRPEDTFVKIYDDYRIKIKITGEFIYKLE